jgi:hypothetical protein
VNYANYANVEMNLYSGNIAAGMPYVTFVTSWTKNQNNPNSQDFSLAWAALNPPPPSPPAPPRPPAPPPAPPETIVVVEDVNENKWAVWTSLALISTVGFATLICALYCCLKNAKVEALENQMEKGGPGEEEPYDGMEATQADTGVRQAFTGARPGAPKRKPLAVSSSCGGGSGFMVVD